MTSNENVWNCISLVLSFRAIERVKHVHHTTIIYWVKQLGDRLPDAPAENNIPEVTKRVYSKLSLAQKKRSSGYGLL